MRYTFLTYSRPESFANVPPEVLGQLKGLFGAYIGALKEAGILVATDWLQPVSAETTVSDGGDRVQDGPFAESKESLGGVYNCLGARTRYGDYLGQKVPDGEVRRCRNPPFVIGRLMALNARMEDVMRASYGRLLSYRAVSKTFCLPRMRSLMLSPRHSSTGLKKCPATRKHGC